MADVFLAADPADVEKADIIARRLRALKMKVFFDKNRENNAGLTTFDDKDARNALKAKTIIVLWSKASVESDFCRAAGSVGRAQGNLIQVGIEECTPYEPFSIDEHASLIGWKGRTVTKDWETIVTRLGAVQGRGDLDKWLHLKASDEAGKLAWKQAHPKDPLSGYKAVAVAKPKKAAPVAAAAAVAGAIGAAAMAAPAAAAAAPAPAPAVEDRMANTEFVGVQDGAKGGLGLWPVWLGLIGLFAVAWIVAGARGEYAPQGALIGKTVGACERVEVAMADQACL